ncbi:MAG: hypothetical protein KA143_05535 [Saprospiraceae bacterium]|nr:hypothetical protein [Saprospiraceae bacterium]
MKLSFFSKVWAFLYLTFGLGLLIVPKLFMSTYGVELDASGQLMARILGSALFAYAVVFWINKNISISEKSWYNLLLASCLYNIMDTPIVLTATLNGTMNSLGWIPVFLHVFLGISMGSFLLKK